MVGKKQKNHAVSKETAGSDCEWRLLLPVVPDVLHVVIIFHGVDELLHHDGLLLVQSLIVLGNHLDLGGDEGGVKPGNSEHFNMT